MVTHNILLSPVKISLEASVQASFRSPSLPPEGVLQNLVPIRSQVVTLKDYRVRMGWPVKVPVVDVRSQSLASVTGIRLADRIEPIEVVTGAAARWCGYPGTYDDDAHVWRPIVGDLGTYRWVSSEDFAPAYVEEFKYQVGKELLSRGALNFDATNRDHMWSQFTGGLVNSTGYTVIMVVWLNSALGNTDNREFSGLWCPGGPVPDPDEDTWDESDITGYSLMLERLGLVVDTENGQGTQGLNASELIATARPIYVAVTFGHPTTTIYGSLGPGTTKKYTASTGSEEHAQSLQVVLGRSNGSLLNTADMALFDLGLYADVLTDEQVEAEIRLLAQSYGS